MNVINKLVFFSKTLIKCINKQFDFAFKNQNMQRIIENKSVIPVWKNDFLHI